MTVQSRVPSPLRSAIRSATGAARPGARLLGEVIGEIISLAGLLGSRTDGDVLVAGELPSIRLRRCGASEIESVARAKRGSEALSPT